MLKRSTRNHYRTLLDAVVFDESHVQKPAIIFVATDADPIIISSEMFCDSVSQYTAALQRIGIVAHDLIVIAHTQNLQSIFAFWGALRLGAVPSMFPTLTEKLDPEIYMRDMRELVRLSGARAVLTTDEFAPTLANHVSCPVFGSQRLLESIKTSNDDIEFQSPPPESIAFLQHSSGTTGLQKGVALSHQAVLNQLASYADALSLTEADIIVSWLPLYHDMGLIAGFVQPLVQGIPLVLMSPFDWVRHPSLLLKAIHDYKATLCWLPNFAYNHCARAIRQRDSDGLDLSSMRAFINCSEPARHDSHLLFLERFAANGVHQDMLSVSYAMAENTFAVTQTTVGEYPAVDTVDRAALNRDLVAVQVENSGEAEQIVSCGQPIDSTQVKVVNEEGHDLPERHVGEIIVKSDSILTGYYNRADLQPFDADGWYRTGDRGYLAKGEVYIIGRSKDLIINAGKNIYPQDIEAIVNTIPGIHPGRVVAFGIPDSREGTELIAVVAEVDTEDTPERKKLTQTIRQKVGQQSDVTVSFVSLVERGWLIKTSSGKIARGKNREKWLAQRPQN